MTIARYEAQSRADRWGAVTAVSTMKRCRAPLLWLVFAFGNTTDLAVRPLLKMRVIALARWTWLPNGRDPRYLLFETNWSGANENYIPDFARVMPVQWRSIWGNVEEFQGPKPTTELMKYVDEVDYGADLFWSDYAKGATTQNVLHALSLLPEVQRFLDDTRHVSPSEFARRWGELTTKIQSLV